MEGYKKASIIYVLKVLEEYSDENHLLTQQEIIDKIYENYELLLERKSVANSISILQDMGYDINKGERGGFYLLDRIFNASEAQYLIDALFSSKSISGKQAKKLSDSISSTLSKYQRKQYNYIYKANDINRNINSDFFLNIELLSDAIKNKKKISFKYIQYDINANEVYPYGDFKHIVSPYYLINNFGKYYLLSYYEKWHNTINYRVDYMRDIEILDDNRVDEKTIDLFKNNFNIDEYINSHIYLFGGKVVYAKIEIDKESSISYVIDWLGRNIKIYKENDKIYAKFKCDDNALFYWALQYSDKIKVIEPKELRDRIILSLKKTLNLYENIEDSSDFEVPLDINELVKRFMYSIRDMNDVEDYSRIDFINRLNSFMKENVSESYTITSDDYSVTIKHNNNEDLKYILNFNYLYSDKDDNKIFNLLRNIKRMEDMKIDGFKAYSILLTKNSTYYKDDENNDIVMDYFTKKKEIPPMTDIRVRNKVIQFNRPHLIEWITIPKTTNDIWFKYYIVEA